MQMKSPKATTGGRYLLTWTTYGTWLPGDVRGFVSYCCQPDGVFAIHNLPGEPYDGDDPVLVQRSRALLTGPPVQLTAGQAELCVRACREVAETHRIEIHAGAVMNNHVHLVVSSEDSDGTRLLNLFKGVSSRRLGQHFGGRRGGSWWTRHGSRRSLRDTDAATAAVNYVMNQPSAWIVFKYERDENPPRERGGSGESSAI